MGWIRRITAALAVAALAFGAITWVALEVSDVARVETRRPDGDARETHVWFVERDDGLWLEAGTPENGWFEDVGRDPRVRLRRGDETPRAYRAVPVPEASPRVRDALRRKYGWRDRWVAIYVPAGRSVAVRLDPVETP